ncbi:hypothetical protein [Burkholderia multivorans]|uniref:hypothetical protein n=1 Tax=Burkholderia multivorans TaxID=87883 RepID=UPI0011B27DD3|nr:hypothetical protein [Burkholderia multivorans]
MNKLEMAQLFSKKLVESHRAEQMMDIIISNRQEENEGVCHSHDYCDANMLMLEVFEENNLSMEDAKNYQLWNEVWDLAKKNEFFYKMSEEKAREYLSQFKDSKIADIYDDYPTLREALGVILPNFEYPDISHKKVSQILK